VFARLHTLDATPEEYEAGFRLVRDELLPWARESTGFRGAIGLVDHDNGKAMILTLWADHETLVASAPAAERLATLAAEASGAGWRSLENFQVSIFDLPGATPPSD
jgi:hypothetical protein